MPQKEMHFLRHNIKETRRIDMNWIPEKNEMYYGDEVIKIKSLEDNSVLFHGTIIDLGLRFDYAPDNLVANNTVSTHPYGFQFCRVFPHNILGNENPELLRYYDHEIKFDDTDEIKNGYSQHVYSFALENGKDLFHARLKKLSMSNSSAKPPYSLLKSEKTQSGEAYKYNIYYCPIKQLIAAGQAPLDYAVVCDPNPWYYELELYIRHGDFYYPDGRAISIGPERTPIIERNSVKLKAWKDGRLIEKRVWYAIQTISMAERYYSDVRITFESDFANNAIFEFEGTFIRKTKKREDTKTGSIAYFSIEGVVSTKGRDGQEIKKPIKIYDEELTEQNFTSLFAGSIFPTKNYARAASNPIGLDDLIGLTKVKETFEEFRCFGEFLRKRNMQCDSEAGKDKLHDIFTSRNKSSLLSANDDAVALHMAFLGSPGTGKTTVAERVAAMLKECGLVVQNEKPIVVVKSDLVGKYIGETEDIVKKKIREAIGGILFVDEAYTLFDGMDSRDFGSIALNEIMYAMEHHRNKLVVIFAGYTDEMLNMLKNANPGFASRIPWKFYFEDYSASEMWDIFCSKVSKGGFKFEHEDSAKSLAKKYFDELKAAYDDVDENGSKKYYFGNGRGVRTFFQYMQMGLAVRCCKTEADDQVFTEEDIEYAYGKFMHNTEKLAISKRAAKIGFDSGS